MALQVSFTYEALEEALDVYSEEAVLAWSVIQKNLRLQAARTRQANCGFPKAWGAILRVPIMRIIVFRDPYWGP